jgi:hypothetical protein
MMRSYVWISVQVKECMSHAVEKGSDLTTSYTTFTVMRVPKRKIRVAIAVAIARGFVRVLQRYTQF